MKKKISLILVIIVVAVQLGWLTTQYAARTEELRSAPTIRLECNGYDPRDFFRGDYVAFTCEQPLLLTDPLLQDLYYWGDPFLDSMKKDWEDNFDDEGRFRYFGTVYQEDGMSMPSDRLKLLDRTKIKYLAPRPARAGARELTSVSQIELETIPVVAFWKEGEDGLGRLSRLAHPGSPQDVICPGERRTPASLSPRMFYAQKADGYVRADMEMTFSLSPGSSPGRSRFRFYVPDNTPSPLSAWFISQPGCTSSADFPANRILQSAEFVCREHCGLMIRNLYLNGIPYVEAIRLLSKNEFPLLEQPLPDNSWAARRARNIRNMP